MEQVKARRSSDTALRSGLAISNAGEADAKESVATTNKPTAADNAAPRPTGIMKPPDLHGVDAPRLYRSQSVAHKSCRKKGGPCSHTNEQCLAGKRLTRGRHVVGIAGSRLWKGACARCLVLVGLLRRGVRPGRRHFLFRFRFAIAGLFHTYSTCAAASGSLLRLRRRKVRNLAQPVLL